MPPRCIIGGEFSVLRALFLLVLLAGAPASGAAQAAAPGDAGITGLVLAPDGSPVTQGAVALVRSSTNHITAAIDRTGHLRIVP